MLKIGIFARVSRVSIKTLRYYDEIGLLRPSEIDPWTGYRYYAVGQLARLNRILALKDLGLSLEQIGQLLDEDMPAEQIRGMLRLKQAEVRQRVEAEQERLARVEARLRQIELEGKMPDYEVVIKEVEPVRVARMCATVACMEEMGPAIGQMFGQLGQAIGQSQTARFAGPTITCYHEMNETQTDIQIEAAFPISGTLPEAGGIEVVELPAGTMACVVHRGSFESMAGAYSALFAWIEQNGYQIVAPTREVYLQYEPDGDPAQYVTELQFPVAKA
ncbi:MAG: MerR family transcriptional regulator [Chloroflexi bacterium]|nr:MerR family transcriptional regulator [Chloroflexota bacterium]